jgi:MlaD protein
MTIHDVSNSGTVRSIALPHSSDGKVTVVMDLDKSTQEIIKRDSLASIETEGVLGSRPGRPANRCRNSKAIARRD